MRCKMAINIKCFIFIRLDLRKDSEYNDIVWDRVLITALTHDSTALPSPRPFGHHINNNYNYMHSVARLD